MKPLTDHVLIRPIKEEVPTSKSGIILTNHDKESRVEKGLVLAVGPGTDKTQMCVYPGNIVMFNKFSGTFVEENGEKLQLVRQGDILGFVVENEMTCPHCGAVVPEGRQICPACEYRVAVTGDTSDGYHTFNELYHHRAVLFSVICSKFKDRAWKAKKHDTGDMYEGMFIVGIETPWGQATYHYDIEPYWDMFDVKELEYAPKWDGHNSNEAIERIAKLASL